MAKQKPETQKSYTVQSTLHHDGVVYSIGETVLLDDGQAGVLLELGVVLPTGKPVGGAPGA